MKKKTLIIAISFIAILALGVFLWTKYFTPPKTEIKTAEAKIGSLKISLSLDGKTSIERRDLKFPVSGKVAKVSVKEGQEIKRGQLLISLDTQDVEKNLQKDLKDFLIERNSFEQTTQVTYPNGSYVDSGDTIKRILENTQYSLDKSVLDVEIRTISLKESYMYAPIDGIVSAINIKQGEFANSQSATSLITITKPDSLYFEAYAEDTEVLKINKDQKTLIKLDAIQNVSFPSKVDFISNLATVDQNGLSTYKVRSNVTDQKTYSLFDGMAGQIQFIIKEKSGILIISNSAVFRENNQSYVNKLLNGSPQKTPVETGFTDGKEVEVISGLSQGDLVLIP